MPRRRALAGHGIVGRHALVAQLWRIIGNEDHVVEDGNAGEGDEADGGRDRERHVAQPERAKMPAHTTAKGTPEKTRTASSRLPIGHEQERQESSDSAIGTTTQRPRLASAFVMLDRSTPFQVIACRGERHLLLDRLLGLFDETSLIAAPNVDVDRNAALAPVTVDLRSSFDTLSKWASLRQSKYVRP